MNSIMFMRNACKSCINHNQHHSLHHYRLSKSLAPPIRRHGVVTAEVQARAYCSKLPASFIRKSKASGLIESLPSFSSSSSSAAVSSRIGFGVVGWYLGLIKTRPVLTKSITSALIYTAADLSAQTLAVPPSEPFDYVRTSRMAVYGMFVLGPSLHLWFNFMSKVVPKRDTLSTLKKIVMGQTTYGPMMTVTFFSTNAFLQGETGGEIVARLKRDLIPTLISGVMYWPICDFITFRFIPVQLQPLVCNSFSYLWTVYMTYMASLEKPAQHLRPALIEA